MKFDIPIVNHSLKYNPSIDGLRGIAVSLVVLFHIYPKYFSFGYAGVDIFFVLSGYLITKIIYTKLEKNTFSFKEFYRNRIRRIFPAMLVVLFFVFTIGYTFTFYDEFVNLGKHIKSSAFFYQNFRLMYEVGYWDKDAILKPLLHFWSLSIEEQFYIFWPLIMVLIYRSRLNFTNVLSGVFLILIVLSLVLQIDTFYHTLSRAWELSFGGFMFMVSCSHKKILKLAHENKITIVFLFFLSILSVLGKEKFNIINIFFIVMFSGFLILSLTDNSKKTLFTNKILVFLGLISFPLYLWHYVIISFAYILDVNVEAFGLVIVFVSILLSYLTYRYVEIYARKQHSYKFSLILIIMAVTFGIAGNYMCKYYDILNLVYEKPIKNYENQLKRLPQKNQKGIELSEKILGKKSINDHIKSTSNDLNKSYVLIMGDSHAYSSYYGFEKKLKNLGYESILVSSNSCPPYMNGGLGKNLKMAIVCKNKIKDVYEIINSKLNIVKIIFIARMGYMYNMKSGVRDTKGKIWNYNFIQEYKENKFDNHKNMFLQVVESTFKYFNSIKNIKFYFLLENPELSSSVVNCIDRISGNINKNCEISYENYKIRFREFTYFITELSNKYRNITILNPIGLYCYNSVCHGIKNRKFLYVDDNHHSVFGSLEQANYVIDKILEK